MAVEVLGNTIRIPQGDTGPVTFVPDKGEAAVGDVGVFTLARRSGGAVLRKILPLNESDNSFSMMFVRSDTVSLKPEAYDWSFRVVRGGVFDENGRLIDAQGQHTAVLNGKLAVLAVAGGAK